MPLDTVGVTVYYTGIDETQVSLPREWSGRRREEASGQGYRLPPEALSHSFTDLSVIEHHMSVTATRLLTMARDLQAIEENRKVCTACEEIDELEIDFPDEPHHGGIRYCGECNAEYYEEYGGEIVGANETGHFNHPEVKLY